MTQIIRSEDYIAKSKETYISRSDNFLSKIDAYLPILGLNEADVAKLKELLPKYKEACKRSKDIHMEAIAETIKCVELEAVCTPEIRKVRKLILASSNCTQATIQDLSLNGLRHAVEMDDQSPELTVRLIAGSAQIKYTKLPFDGIRLFCSINNGESHYEETITQNTYTDTKPRIHPGQPEIREYYAYYIKKGKIVGQKSKTVKIILEAIE